MPTFTIPFSARMPEGWTDPSWGTFERRFLAVNGATKTTPDWADVVDAYTDHPIGALDDPGTETYIGIDQPGYDAYARSIPMSTIPSITYYLHVYGRQAAPVEVPAWEDVQVGGAVRVYPHVIARRRGADVFLYQTTTSGGSTYGGDDLAFPVDLGGGWEKLRTQWFLSSEAQWNQFAALVASGDAVFAVSTDSVAEAFDVAWIAIEFAYQEAAEAPVLRVHPRSDGRGLSSARRVWPPSKVSQDHRWLPYGGGYR